MTVIKKSYDSDAIFQRKKRPLLIGCSGGYGHISAINGIYSYLRKNFPADSLDLPLYQPVLKEEKGNNFAKEQIQIGQLLMHNYRISPALREVVKHSHYPVLPDMISLDAETNVLNDRVRQEKASGGRHYVDMLLDVYPAGFENAGIWNNLQKNDQVKELKKLITLQSYSDHQNYSIVRDYYWNLLSSAALRNIPYTEIISSQAMALAALCDVACEYNNWIITQNLEFPLLIIHQYFTDLPTVGAVHYANSLARLTSVQQKQMKLYGVGMSTNFISHFFPNGQQFAGLYDIPLKNNPMVRPGFTDPALDFSGKFHENCSFKLRGQHNELQPYFIVADRQIATLMLGSQASNETVNYIETLLTHGYEELFIIGGFNDFISKGLNTIIARHPVHQNKIIRVSSNQDDQTLTPLMTRSNLVDNRGGGLIAMEHMAMPHNPEQTILIHHADTPDIEPDESNLTSGICWEDCNVDELISEMNKIDVNCRKTTPQLAKSQVPKARLRAALKMEQQQLERAIQQKKKLVTASQETNHEISRLTQQRSTILKLEKMISQLRETDLEVFVSLLNSKLIKPPFRFVDFFNAYENLCKTPESKKRWILALNSKVNETKLDELVIEKFLNPQSHENFFNIEFLSKILKRINNYVDGLAEQEKDEARSLCRELAITIAEHNLELVKNKIQQSVFNIKKNKSEQAQFGNFLEALDRQIQIKADLIFLDQLLAENTGPVFTASVPDSFDQALITPRLVLAAEIKPQLLIVIEELKLQLLSYKALIDQKLSDAKARKARFFIPDILSYVDRIEKKNDITDDLLTKIEALRDLARLQEKGVATQLSMLLVTAHKRNQELREMAWRASVGRLGNILTTHISYLQKQFSLSYHDGLSQLSECSLIQENAFSRFNTLN